MEFRDSIRWIVESMQWSLDDPQIDLKVLNAFAGSCKSSRDYLQLQEYKNILSTGTMLLSELNRAYHECRANSDLSFQKLAQTIEQIADSLEDAGISCFSYSYFISGFIYLIADINLDGAIIDTGIARLDWIDPEHYDYGYQTAIGGEKSFGVGRYKASIKDFFIKSGKLIKYTGKDAFVIVPDMVREVGASAFESNQYVKAVYCSSSVVKIGENAFSGCSGLETVCLGDGVTRIPVGAFEGCKLLKRINLGKIKSIGDRGLKSCVLLRQVDLSSLKSIGDEAFAYCVGMQNFDFLSHISRIGTRAFAYCRARYVSLKNSVLVSDYAFENCADLTNIDIDLSKVQFKDAPFHGCCGISEANLTGQNRSFALFRLFESSLLDFNLKYKKLQSVKIDHLIEGEFADCLNLLKVEVRNASVVSARSFSGCRSLQRVDFQKEIVSVETGAFENCVHLTELNASFSEASIAEKAFYRCSGLDVSPILNRVCYVGNYAFAYTNLQTFDFKHHFDHIGAFAFANAHFKDGVSLDLTDTVVLPGAFHGISNVDLLRIDSLETLFRGNLSLLFEQTLELFLRKLKINNLFVNRAIRFGNLSNYENVRCVEISFTDGIIPDGMFWNCTGLESVKIAGRIDSIGKNALKNCPALSNIEWQLSDSVNIGESAFEGSPDAVAYMDLSRVNSLGNRALANTDLSQADLSNVTFLGYGVFEGCSDLHSLTIPFVGCNAEDENGTVGQLFSEPNRSCANRSVQHLSILSSSIPEYAVTGFENLETLNLPNVAAFTKQVVQDCPNLILIGFGDKLKDFSCRAIPDDCKAKITISEHNPNFVEDHCAVLSLDKTILYYLPADADFAALSKQISTIKSFAVRKSENDVTIDANIRTLEPFAIDCSLTKTLTVNTQGRIFEHAFYHCDNIDVIDIQSGQWKEAFSFDQDAVHLKSVALRGMNIHKVAALFSSGVTYQIDSLMLDDVVVQSDMPFDLIQDISFLRIHTGNCFKKAIQSGCRIQKVSMCAQEIPLSFLFDTMELGIISVEYAGDRIRENEFAGVVVESLTILNAKTIEKNAFKKATIASLHLENIGKIEPMAFHLSMIDHFDIRCPNIVVENGLVLEDGKTLVYCLDSSVDTVVIPLQVESVLSGAFESRKRLRKVVCHRENTIFHDHAFIQCNALAEIDFAAVICSSISNLFDDSASVTKITYKGKSIPRKFFSNLSNLLSVDLTQVESIGDLAFANDRELKEVRELGSVERIGAMAFAHCASIKELSINPKCTFIDIGAFEDCGLLERIAYPIDHNQEALGFTWQTIFGLNGKAPRSITVNAGNIPAHYFKNCHASVSIVSDAETIGEEALFDCHIGTIKTASVKSIGSRAFAGSSLTEIVLPKCASIGEEAFLECRDLENIELNNKLQDIGANWIRGTRVSVIKGAENGECYQTIANMVLDRKSKSVHSIAPNSPNREVVVPSGITRISSSSFENSNVEAIDAQRVEVIEESAFSNCRKLERLTVPFLGKNAGNPFPLSYWFGDKSSKLKHLTILRGKIVPKAFLNQGSLESVKLPLKLAELGDNTFSGCGSLQSVSSLEDVESFGTNVFAECYSLKELSLPFIGPTIDSCTKLCYLMPGRPQGYHLSTLTVSGGTIAGECFAGFETLEKISLPTDIRKIPAGCFENCISLKDVAPLTKVDDVGERAFSGCKQLKEIRLPNVRTVREAAFDHCEKLTVVSIANQAECLKDGIFNGCNSLKALTLPSLNQTIGQLGDLLSLTLETIEVSGNNLQNHFCDGFSSLNTVVIKGKTGTLPEYAFRDCVNLQNISIEARLETIGTGAFENCAALEKCSFIEGAKYIHDGAFLNSAIHGKIKLSAALKLGESAFEGAGLESISFSNSLTKIPTACFKNCRQLKEVQMPKVLFEVDDYAFSGCCELTEIDLSKIVSIGIYAFENCQKLPAVRLDVIETLGAYAFSDCAQLLECELSDKLRKLSEGIFRNSGIHAIKLPAELQEIETLAFAGTSIEQLDVPETLKTVGAEIFKNASAPIVYVSSGQTDSWDPNWNNGCRRHGFLWLGSKVPTKIRKK